MEDDWLDIELLDELQETVGDLVGEVVFKFEKILRNSPLFGQSADDELSMAFHKLAGSAGSLGMKRLSSVLKEAEKATLDGREVALPELRDLALESLERLRARLDATPGERGS